MARGSPFKRGSPLKRGSPTKRCPSTYRPLGLWEQVCTMAQRRSGLYNVASKSVISTTKHINRDIIQESLKKLSQRHPLLRCVIGKVSGKVCFIINDVQPVLNFTQLDEAKAMELELLDVFKDRENLWRVTYTNPIEKDGRFYHTFIFTFHHAIVDGTAIIQIHRDFITFLEMSLRDIDEEVISLPLKPSRDVIFNQQAHCRVTKRLRHALSYLFTDCVTPTVQQDALVQAIVHNFRPANPIRRTRCVQIDFDCDQTERLLRYAKDEKVRLNAVLTTVAARALRLLLLEHNVIGIDITNDYLMECYVNLRRFTDLLSPEDVGLYMTHVSVPVSFMYCTSDFWVESRLYDESLHSKLEADIHFNEYKHFQSAIKSLGPSNISKVISFTDHRSMPYYISNLGKCTIVPEVSGVDDYHCTFETLHQTVGEHPKLVDGSVFVNSVVTVNGRLFWTLGYHCHQVTDEIAQELGNKIKETIFKTIGE